MTSSSRKIDVSIDTRGKVCPYPLIDARDALKKMVTGQTLEVVSDYEPAVMTTIPNFCEKKHYPHETETLDENLWRVLIQKAD